MRFLRSRDRTTPEQKQSPKQKQIQHGGPSLDRATALFTDGHYAEAEAEARAVGAFRSWPWEAAPVALRLAATAAGAQGRHAEAHAEYDELLPVFRRVFGAEHPQTLVLRSNRAHSLGLLGRYAESERECAHIARAAAGGTAPGMPRLAAAAQCGLVYALNGQERHREAEILAREALGAPRETRFLLVLRLGLVRSLNGQGRYEEALAEAERAADLLSGMSENLRRPETGAVELAMATALLGLGRTAEAQAQAASAHDACLAAFGPAHHRTREAQDLLHRITTP